MRVHTYDGTDLTNRVSTEAETSGFATSAKLGEAEIINITVDDPLSELAFVGHKPWLITEDECPAGSQVIWCGHVARKTVNRGSYPTGVGRVWLLQVVEANKLLERRLLRPETSTCKRPAETVDARVAWVLTVPGMTGVVVDAGLVESSSVPMDARDYTDQTPADVLRECALVAGFNHFIRYREATSDFQLIFRNEGTSALDVSLLQVSDVIADVDGATTWYPNLEPNIEQIPDRVASGISVPYEGGSVYVSDPTTAATFAEVDLVAPSAFVKTAAAATALGDHLLEQHSTEEEIVTGLELLLPAARINDVFAGQLMAARFVYGPGWETLRSARVSRKVIKRPPNLNPDLYIVELELQPATPDFGVAEAVSIRLERPNDNYTAGTLAWNLGFDYDGDNFQAGDPPSPKVGPVDYYPVGTKPANGWEGIVANGDGTLSFSALASALGVANGASSCTLAITVNGATVGSGTQSNSTAGLHVQGYALQVTASNIAIANGDIVKAHISFTGSWPGTPVIPSGTGNPTHHLLASGYLTP